ncbi:MAG: magnesium transporter, partial [Kiritimatiellia bacterium]|nr:magnesium transporter [Kiritimatiellia bacterium]
AEMSTEFAAVPQEMTIGQALERIRQQMPSRKDVYSVYVVDDHHRLIGELTLQEMLFVPLNRKVSEVMHSDVISARVDEDLRPAVDKVKEYDLAVLPVVQSSGRLAGILTIDDVLDVQAAEATEDFHKLGSVISVSESVRDAGRWILYRARIPWLLALIVVNIFSGAGLAYFESTIQALVVLVFFLPLLTDSGGNAGAQSATLVVRALATGDVTSRDWLGLFLKEIRMAAALGLVMGLVASVLGVWRGGTEIALIVGLTMFFVVLAGSLMGLCLPFLLTRLKLDPATASSPLVASMADIVGVLIYFGIASRFVAR